MIDRSDKKPSDYITPLPYSENNTNTFQENTFTLENHLDSFITTNKDERNQIESYYSPSRKDNAKQGRQP